MIDLKMFLSTFVVVIFAISVSPSFAQKTSHLHQLACADGQIAKLVSGVWTCAADETGSDTLSGLTCTQDEIAKYDGSAWVCAKDETGGNGNGNGNGVPTYVIKDGTGAVMGPALGALNPDTVLVIQGHLIPVVVDPSIIRPLRQVTSRFESTDCSGPIWIDASVVTEIINGLNTAFLEPVNSSVYRLLEVTSDVSVYVVRVI